MDLRRIRCKEKGRVLWTYISHFEADVGAHDVVLQYVRFSVVLTNKSSVAAVKGQTFHFLCLLDSN